MIEVRRRLVEGLLAAVAVGALVGWTPNRQPPPPPPPPPQQSVRDSGRLDCTACHPAVHATMVGTASDKASRCITCHVAAHDAVRALYSGGGTNPAVRADPMSRARVDCRGCHTDQALGAQSAAPRLAAIGRACTACHGTRFDKMLPRWAEGLNWRARAADEYVASANADSRLAVRPDAQARLRDAAADLARIRLGLGLHNVSAADALLRSAVGKTAAAYRSAGVSAPPPPSLGPDPAATSCAYCHYGVEGARDTVGGRPFDHADHVIRADVACRRCHSPADYFAPGTRAVDARHGQTTVTTAACNACHHVTSGLACTTCHTPQALASRTVPVTLPLTLTPAGAPSARAVAFRHDAHAAVACADCHTSRTSIRTVAACASCHETHHRDARDCTACHGATLATEHKAADHFACAECHATPTLALLTGDRTFCLTCHADRREHHPSRECAPCHLQMSPAEVRARILGRRP
jgi:Class III cytochrome C family